MNLLCYSLDCNANEAVWGWAGEEVTGNLFLGDQDPGAGDRQQTASVGQASRRDKVKRRCRTVLQWMAETLLRNLRLDTKDLKMHIPPWL